MPSEKQYRRWRSGAPSAVTVKYILSPAARFMQCASIKSRQDSCDASQPFLARCRTHGRGTRISTPQRPCIHTLLSVEYISPPARQGRCRRRRVTSSMPFLSQKSTLFFSSDCIHSLAPRSFCLSMMFSPFSSVHSFGFHISYSSIKENNFQEYFCLKYFFIFLVTAAPRRDIIHYIQVTS